MSGETADRGRSASGVGRGRKGSGSGTVRGRLRASDPFELIRWLALSQPDPRKALSELVQNSLDAAAHRIRVIRVRERRVPCLKILDDGEGVIPEMERAEALRYIATHIGHSRKRALSPQERLQLMTQGQYGIGLLGFWSLGETLEIRTGVPGQRAHRLVLHRDRADFVIEPIGGRLPMDDRWTEVVIVGLHAEAATALIGGRAADYLAGELRGQLLSRKVDLVVEDRMSRGRARKQIPVRPPRFLGERLEGLGLLEMPGYPPIRLELYFTGQVPDGAEARGIAVYSAGTLVAEDFGDLGALGLDRSPWTDGRLSGMVDFPAFQVAPGSRRGVIVNDAAGAFAGALLTVEPMLCDLLDSFERRREEELDRTLIRDLQRAFRDFYRHRPRYAMLPVRAEPENAAAAADGAGAAADGAPAGAEAEGSPAGEAGASPMPVVDLLPPGPLAAARLVPASLRLPPGDRRTVRALGLDAGGREVEDALEFEWRVEGAIGTLLTTNDPRGWGLTSVGGSAGGAGGEPRDPEGEKPGVAPGEDDRGATAGAPERNGPTGSSVVLVAAAAPASGRIAVTVRSGATAVVAEAEVRIAEEQEEARPGEGIPEPELVDSPGAAWRSRMEDGRWQVNTGHREYRAIVDRPALKLRYLAMLFAKEIVLRSSQDPRLERPLEQLVEIATYADRNLSRRGRRRS